MKSSEKLKMIIADDHGIVRSGIKQVLGDHNGIDIIAEASSYTELDELLNELSCDILILDLNLGDKNGIQNIRDISDRFNALSILVLSMFPEDPYALQSIQAGAKGYVSKRSMLEEILDAVEHILNDKIYLSENFRKTLPFGTELEKSSKPSIESLSQREYEVYTLLSQGLTSKEIAEKLSLSPKTVSTYRTRVLSKLSLSSTNQLIHFAMQNDMGE